MRSKGPRPNFLLSLWLTFEFYSGKEEIMNWSLPCTSASRIQVRGEFVPSIEEESEEYKNCV